MKIEDLKNKMSVEYNNTINEAVATLTVRHFIKCLPDDYSDHKSSIEANAKEGIVRFLYQDPEQEFYECLDDILTWACPIDSVKFMEAVNKLRALARFKPSDL